VSNSSIAQGEGSALPTSALSSEGSAPYSDRVKCTSCENGTGPNGCTDCLNTGHDPQAFAGGIDAALNDAYAEGRKDERESLSKAARDILAERERQQTAEGYTTARDDFYVPDDLADAAGAYALVGHFGRTGIAAADAWPWDASTFKPRDQRRNYVRAAALLQAAVELIDRQEAWCDCAKRLAGRVALRQAAQQSQAHDSTTVSPGGEGARPDEQGDPA
jgi:hypothetical protein